MKRLITLTEYTAAFFLMAIALLTFANVLVRELLSTQIPDWFDFTKQLQGIAIFWGIALATLRGGHICVDIVWEHLSRRGRLIMDVFATSVTTVCLGVTAWMVWTKWASTGTQTTNDLRIPLVYFFAVAAAGATAAAFMGVMRLVQLIRERNDPNAGAIHG